MKVCQFTALAIVLAIASNHAIAASNEQVASAEQTEKVEKQIRKLNSDFFQSIGTLDLPLFNRVVAENALFTRNNSTITTREVVLSGFSRTVPENTVDIKNVRVVGVGVTGTSAVIIGRLWARDNRKKDYYLGFTNVFTKASDEAWKLITSSVQSNK